MARDHYVQQELQRGFVDSSGAFHLFNKREWKCHYPVHPRDVLFEKNYETPLLAEALRSIEHFGLVGLNLLRGRQYDALTNDIFQGLMIYLIAHLTRSPHHFEELRARTPEDREVAFQTET